MQNPLIPFLVIVSLLEGRHCHAPLQQWQELGNSIQ